MRNNYHCILIQYIKNRLLLVVVAMFPLLSFGQLGSQSPSIRTGDTFDWSDTQSNNSDAATIQKVTVNGTE
ncbi:hypothetical protein [Pseudotamlana carrageenivorans]|uniref:hypothetical protein n=1 Tax=Pseudotamlana carrageenivorans TaxID=2069432 RepID=UPI0013155C7C|nr:hypothetical protein [Tamlana carrageenivorans]